MTEVISSAHFMLQGKESYSAQKYAAVNILKLSKTEDIKGII